MRILIVEDDRSLGNGLLIGLQQQGFTTDLVRDGVQALQSLADSRYAAVVLDLGLPGCDGLSVLQKMRQRQDDTPVLILTARDRIEDRIRGLDAGADDYLLKPFDLGEVAAHLRALVRRAAGRSAPLLRQGDLELDPAARKVTVAGQPVDLSGRELQVLQLLLEAAGRVLTKGQIEEQLYAWGSEIGSNTVEVFISHLRRKLRPDLIRTLRGIGYTIDK